MWEQSGQGDGGQICDDEEEEENENKESPCNLPVPGLLVHDRSHGVLNHQSAFVANNQSYILYYWELMDKHDLL